MKLISYTKTILLSLVLTSSYSAFAGVEIFPAHALNDPAYDNDVKQLEELFAKSSTSSGVCYPATPHAQLELILNGIEEPALADGVMRPQCAVYSDDKTGAIIGFIIYTLAPRSLKAYNRTLLSITNGIIIELEIDENYRELGYEQALVDHALNEFKKAGCYYLLTKVVDDNSPYTNFLLNLYAEDAQFSFLHVLQTCVFPAAGEYYDQLEGPVFIDNASKFRYKIDGPRSYVFEKQLCSIPTSLIWSNKNKALGGALLAAIGSYWAWSK